MPTNIDAAMAQQQKRSPPDNVIPLKRPRRTGAVTRKLGWALRAIATLAVLSGLAAGYYYLSPERAVETIEMKADFVRIVDADTIAVGDLSIRLKGIAAPELGHPTYDPGRHYLGTELRKASKVICKLTNETTYDCRVGRCYFEHSDGQIVDAQRAVVAAGYARGCPRYGGWRYWLYETSASRNLPLPDYCRGFSLF